MIHRFHRLFVAAPALVAALALGSAAGAQAVPATAPDSPSAPAAPANPAPVAPATDSTPSPSPSVGPGGLVAPPPAGKGQIVFFRPGAYLGMAVSFSIHEGATGVGKLGNNSYFVYVGDPGPHTFTVRSEATDTLNLEIDAGETYYVKETLGMGLVLYRPHLTPSDEATFEAKKLKLSTQKATDLAPGDVKAAAAAPAVAQ